MRPRLPWLHSICAVLSLTAAHAVADSSPLVEHRVMIPERGEVLGYIIKVDTNHYSFLPPPGWRTSCKPGSKAVVMIAADLTTSITIDFLEADTKTAQELLGSRYPEAKARRNFTCLTGLGEGAAFDIERKTADAPTIASRVIYAMHESGVVEFTLTTPKSRFPEWTTTFANVVNSFHRPVR
jgi:hypothetical protein